MCSNYTVTFSEVKSFKWNFCRFQDALCWGLSRAIQIIFRCRQHRELHISSFKVTMKSESAPWRTRTPTPAPQIPCEAFFMCNEPDILLFNLSVKSDFSLHGSQNLIQRHQQLAIEQHKEIIISSGCFNADLNMPGGMSLDMKERNSERDSWDVCWDAPLSSSLY